MSQRKTTRTILLLLVFCLLLSFMPSGVIVQATEAETEASAAAVVTPGTDSAADFQLEAYTQPLNPADDVVLPYGVAVGADMVPYSVSYSFERVNEGQTLALSTAGISGAITWASNNTAVATVNSSGVVTGLMAGRADITATVGGVVQHQYVVWVTIPDGQYLIQSTVSDVYLMPKVIPYTTGTYLKCAARATDSAEALSQMWYIEYLDEGTYMISAIQNADLHITSLGDSDIYLHTEADTSTHQWLIYHDAGGYRIVSYDMGPGMMTYTAPSTYVPNGRIEIDYPFTCQAKHYWNFVPVSNDLTLNEGAASTLSAAGISGTITWGSSNATVATVNASGVVTAVRAGRATVTARVNGAIQRTYNILVTIPDGQYLINHYTGAYYLTPDVISYANNTQLSTKSRSSNQAIGTSQIWNIQHQGNGYYTVSTIYKNNLRLSGFDGTTPTVTTTVSNNAHLWKIQYNTNGYEFINKTYSNSALAPAPDTGYAYDEAGLRLKTHSSSDATQRWQLTRNTGAGLLLLDSTTGERRDEEVYLEYMPMRINTAVTLGDLGLDLYIVGGNDASPTYTISIANTAMATYNPVQQTLYGHGYGQIVANIQATINNQVYLLPFRLHICTDYANVAVLYDNAYKERYSDYLDDINSQTQKLKQLFHESFGILLSISDAADFTSYADLCPKEGSWQDALLGTAYYNIACTCGECKETIINQDGSYTAETYHHTNASNILVRLPRYNNAKTLAYIGHKPCTTLLDSCYSGSPYGIASPILGVAGVMDHEGLAHSTATTVHEIGHLFGAPDHYGDKCPSTEDLNDKFNDADPFDRNCIYGEYKDLESTYSDITICSGCWQVICNKLDIP